MLLYSPFGCIATICAQKGFNITFRAWMQLGCLCFIVTEILIQKGWQNGKCSHLITIRKQCQTKVQK